MINKVIETDDIVAITFGLKQVDYAGQIDPVLYAAKIFYSNLQGYIKEYLVLPELPDLDFNSFKRVIGIPVSKCVMDESGLHWEYRVTLQINKEAAQAKPSIGNNKWIPRPLVVPTANVQKAGRPKRG
jgi:hypothetical protein